MSASNESFQAPPPPPPTTESKPRAPRAVKLRPFGIAFFVLGLLVLGAAIPGILPGSVGTAAAICFVGILLFAFSFIPLPVIPNEEAPLSFFDRVTGIFYEPSRVFRNLKVHPQWVGAYVGVVVLSTIYTFAFVQRITPERIVEHMTQKVAEMPAPFTPPPEAIEKMRTDQMAQLKDPIQRAGTVVKSAVGLYVLGAFVAGLSMLLILVFGGRINYLQSLAVVFHVWLPVMAIQKVLGLVILYLKAPEDLHPILHQETTLQDNLGILMSPAEHPVLFVMLSFIGLTWFYLVWLRAKGLRFAGTKVSSGAAWGVSLTIYILFMLFAMVMTALFPSFIS